MKEQQAINLAKQLLPTHRFEHSLRVRETALKLARKFDVNPEKIAIAAILHDICKYEDEAVMRNYIKNAQMDKRLLDYGSEVLHGPAAAAKLAQEYQLLDQDIALAITYHTIGRVGMSDIEKIIFVADYIEPGRTHAACQQVAHIAFDNIDKAIYQICLNTLQFLISKEVMIFPTLVELYNDYKFKKF